VERTSIRYRRRRGDDGAVRKRLRELAAVRRRFGWRRLHVLLSREGLQVLVCSCCSSPVSYVPVLGRNHPVRDRAPRRDVEPLMPGNCATPAMVVSRSRLPVFDSCR
jgi:hypothetical protein